MKNFVQQNKKNLILCGVGLTIGAGLIYWYIKKKKNCLTSSSIYLKKQTTFDQKYATIINQVQQLLDKSTKQSGNNQLLYKIYRGQYILSSEQAKSEILKGRKQRRKAFDDRVWYAQIIATSQRQLQLLLQKHLSAILARFNIDKSQWAQYVSQLYAQSQQARNEWQQMIKDQDQKLIANLRNPKQVPISFSEIKKILKLKIKKLQELKIQDLALNVGIDETAKLNILQSYLRDVAYFQFGVQEETLLFSVSVLQQSQKQSLQYLYDQISNLMSNFIFDDIDIDGQNVFGLNSPDSDSVYY